MFRRLFYIVIAIVAAIVLFALIERRNAPPEVPFTKVVRESIISALTTNGKVEPIDWASARAETAGAVEHVYIRRGQHVAKGETLVELDTAPLQSEVSAAEARVAQTRAELRTIEQGGRPADIASINASLDAAKQELGVAQREYEANVRLAEKHAVTGQEVQASRERVERAQLQIQSLQQRKATVVSATDRQAAEARLHEAEAAVTGAREKMARASIQSPIAGTVYQFDLRPGSYLNPGDLVASIGRLANVRVIVYVDEPDLGRVQVGMPVTITWDALPGRTWTGAVERKPTQVIALGTRQVGEVSCVIGNPDLDLLPGTNVNAEIRSKEVNNALAIPNAAIRRENGRTGVYVLTGGNQIEWRDVKIGVTSVVRAQVVAGLNEGDSIALPTDRTLKNEMLVTPTYP